jgi:hypothetical protein
MRLRLLLATTFFGVAWLTSPALTKATTAPSPAFGAALAKARSSAPSPSPSPTYSTAPYAERLAAAKSVKVMTSILGVKLGATLESAHKKLDKLCDPAHQPKEEKEEETKEGERKVLWELSKTNYSSIFVKADDQGKIIYVSGFLRPGKEIPFEKIGETGKAPIQTASTIGWDILRPKQPLYRVVASGANRKANNIMLFVVKRPGLNSSVFSSSK